MRGGVDRCGVVVDRAADEGEGGTFAQALGGQIVAAAADGRGAVSACACAGAPLMRHARHERRTRLVHLRRRSVRGLRLAVLKVLGLPHLAWGEAHG